jgi:VCBS repeat-containing protein
MESDQLPVEENLKENLDLSHQGETPEAIAILENESDEEIVEAVGQSIDETIQIDQSPSDNSLAKLPDDEILNTSEILTIINQLKHEESELREELERLKNIKSKILQDQLDDLQAGIIRLAQADVARLEYQKQELQAAIAVLEKRKERLDKEMISTYAGTSQDIAIRVQGFKDYLVGSLQDLVANAEKLNLVAPSAQPVAETVVPTDKQPAKESEPLRLSEQTFAEYKQRVDQLLERYRTLPDYYGPAWKLRRTFEQVHADRVSKWFFEQSGRGAIRTMGTRLQNILVTSAAISVLKAVYGEKLRVLVLATSPERLGEWRRGFQDCLGLTREHFGSDKGIALFEDPEPLATKGDRMVKEGLSPLVVIDESEELIAVDLLRFPLLIAFGGAPDVKPATPSAYMNRDSSRESQNNRDYIREAPRDNPRDNPRDTGRDYAPPKDRDNRDYGSRDYPSRNYSDRDPSSGNNRGRNNQDSDWDW